MKKLTFATNVNCGKCLTKITPSLDAASHVQKWLVDTTSEQKMLTVSVASETTAEDVMSTVRAAGFTAEEVQF